MRGPGLRLSRADTAIAAALAALAMGFFALNVDRELNLAEEGTILYIGERINRGMVLYRDMNHHVSPGVFYLTAGLLRAFGTSVMPTRWFMLSLFGATAALLYLMGTRLSTRAFAALAAVTFVFLERRYYSVIYYSPIAIFLGLLSLAAILAYQRRGSVSLAGAAGAFGGLVLSFKQDFAAYTVAAGCLSLLLAATVLRDGESHPRTWRALVRAGLAYTAGFTAALAPIVAYFAWHGALGDIFQYCVLFIIHGFSRDYALPWPDPVAPLPAMLDLGQKVEWMHLRVGLYGALALFAMATGAAGLRVMQRRPSPALLRYVSVLLLSGLTFLGAFPRTDGYHVVIVLPPALLLAAMTLSAVPAVVAGPHRPEARELGSGLLAVAVAIPLAAGVRLSVAADLAERRERSTPLDHPRARVKLGEPKARALTKLLDYLRGHVGPGQGVFVLPYEPGIYFLSGIDNPTRYDMVLPGNVNAASEREIVAALERQRVPYIVLIEQYHFDFLKFRKLHEYAPDLYRYVYETYRIPADYDVEPTANVGIVGARVAGGTAPPFTVTHDLVDLFREYLWGIVLPGGRRIQGIRTEPESDDVKGWWWVGRRDWMLRRVLFVHPEVASDRTRYVDYRVKLPEGGALRFGMSLFEEVWDRDGRGVAYQVFVVDGGSERGVYSRFVDPFHVPGHRRWLDAEVDLSPWAGREVTLSLRVSSTSDTNAYAWSGWGDPRVVSYPPGAPPAPGDRDEPVERVLADLLSNRARIDIERGGAAEPDAGAPPAAVRPFGDQLCLLLHTVADPDVWRVASWDVDVPAAARLLASYGMASDVWPADGGEGARFRIELRDAAGETHVLAGGEANPRRRREDWRMFPVEADLTPWEGQRVTLRFMTASRQGTNEYGWAVFGSPRLVLSR